MNAKASIGPMRRMVVALRRPRPMVVFVLVLMLTLSGTAFAAEVASEEIYILPSGEVVNDDLYVTGQEVIIDGTVEGDLVAFGGYVEVNGVVTGDLIVAAGGIEVNGVVQDDARLAGASITIDGSIGDDLFAVGGGSGPGVPTFPFAIGERPIVPGVRLNGPATVGGDAYVVGGSGVIAGAVGGDLYSAMGSLRFGGRVMGDATLQAGTLEIADAAEVGGELRYSTEQAVTVPDGTAETVTEEPAEVPTTRAERNPFRGFLWWLLRTVQILLGSVILGWLFLQFRRNSMTKMADTIEGRTVEAGIFGLLVAVGVLPVSAVLVFLGVLFWGWFPGGIVVFMFLFGGFAILWIVSPVLSGLWLGRKVTQALRMQSGDLLSLAVGILIIVLLGRVLGAIPCVGHLAYRIVYLLSFALAAGGWLLAQRRVQSVEAPPAEAPSA